MAKSRIFQVRSNRIRFKCAECQTVRSLPVPPNVRRRSARCHKCGVITQCQLNRRLQPRESQSGKVTMVTRDGSEIDILLHDISPNGVGIKVPPGTARKLSLKQEVQFRCSWNSRLLAGKRYVVKNIKENYIGVQAI